MRIEQFGADDIDGFMTLAQDEGWVCDLWEFEFLFRVFPAGCLVARDEGRPAGFVTAIRYGTSGWIGNLIVRPDYRGRGIGSLLMGKALSALDEAGTATVWLTASRSGKPLYEKLGFTAIDVINRWVSTGLGCSKREQSRSTRAGILDLDHSGWGDRREAIIDAVVARGRLFTADDAFLVCQPCCDGTQIGPWGGGAGCAPLLLARARAEAGDGKRIYLDVPTRNATQSVLLNESGFTVKGSNLLMFRGAMPAYAPERIFALASMGSMG
jgi:ribosomal protein S18 acetylase RimI-like enzyme